MTVLGDTSATVLEPREVYTDPRADTVWRHEGAWWAPLSWRPHLGAVALGLGMVLVTIVIALWEDLPLRDADGIFGERMFILLGTLGAFFALEIIPRTWNRWRDGSAPVTALRAVLADRWSKRRLRVVVIGIVAFYATYISYRNLKSYLPFLTDQNQDAALYDFERSLFGGHDPG